MFLLKINKIQNKTVVNIVNKILFNIKLLAFLKKKKKVKNLKSILIFLLVKKIKNVYYKDHLNRHQIIKKISQNKFSPTQCVHYIININLTYTNTFINVTDIKGHVKLSYSGGSGFLKSKQKVKQPTAILTLLKQLVSTADFLTNSFLAIHFKNTKTYYEYYVIKLLKQKFFIKTVRSYNFRPHNGCRLKKIKRLKKMILHSF
jgi:ribosomal protein S11